MRGIPKEQIVTKRYEKENAERKNHLQDLQTQRNKAEKDLLALKTEVLACIKGESVLPRETLAEMITAQEEKLTELENLCEAASEELEKTAEEYLSDYGIKPGEYQIYMETEEHSDSAEGVYLLLRLPARVMDQSLTISRALGYQLGVDVRIETYGKDAG